MKSNLILDLLKLDLAQREDNKYIASKLGGNSSELFWLMNNEYIFNKDILNKDLDKINLAELRKELSEFLKSKNIDNISFERITNLKYLKDIKNPSTEVLQLIDCIKATLLLKNSLNKKENIREQISLHFLNEKTKYKEEYDKHFCSDKKLYDNCWDDNNKREADACFSLISYDDRILFEDIKKYPAFIQAICFRSFIGITKLFSFSLDRCLWGNDIFNKYTELSK